MKEIYILEDDVDIRELMEFLLEGHYKVKSFATTESFCRQVVTHLPDLFLLDIMLPDGNGAELCKKIKSEASTSSIPVVLMSAHIEPKLITYSCADDFISKPFDIDDLLKRLELQFDPNSDQVSGNNE